MTLDTTEIRKRHAATTQGEWLVKKAGSDALGWHFSLCEWDTDPVERTEANITFMAEAHKDVPALCDEVDRLRAALREVDAAMDRGEWLAARALIAKTMKGGGA